MSASKKGVNQAVAVEKQRQALDLRRGGATFQAIADQLGYAHPSGAAKAVSTALQRTVQEPADELRMIESMRLDRLHLALWPRAIKGDLGAVDRVLRIMERRAKLLGLDAPQTVNVSHEMREIAERVADSLGLNVNDILAEAERIVAAAGLND